MVSIPFRPAFYTIFGLKTVSLIIGTQGNLHGIARVNYKLGNIHRDIGELDKAINYYQQAWEIFEQLGDVKGLAYTYHNLIHIHDYKDDTETANKLSQRAIKLRLANTNELTNAGNWSDGLPKEPIISLDDEDATTLGGEISPELLEILVCPEDKGPLQLTSEGKFLLNPRNGYKYPIRQGMPIMLIEEGKKYRDLSYTATTG